MEEFKSPVSRLARLFKKSRDAWKAKALEKQRRLRAVQVKVRDLEHSREQWKKRALEAEKALTGAVTGPEKADEPPASSGERQEMGAPVGHHYRVMEMQLVIGMYLDAGVGSRSVGRVLDLISAYFPVATPAYTTVLNWVYRCGLYVLNRTLEWRPDWIFVADHTIALGQAKCLVILGIPASELETTGYSPTHRDMQVLAVEVTTHSTGTWVAEVLDRVCQRVGPPVQIVADQGSDLHKGIELFRQHWPESVYTYDISHRIATLFKAELGQDARWNAFLAHCGDSLARLQQTELAFLRPPRQRTKARFMHVDAHLEWAQRLLAYHDRGDFSAIEARFSLDGSRWQVLVEQFGPGPTLALRSLIAIPYPSAAAFRQALEGVLGADVERLDEAFWHSADAGRRRFLERFGWLLDYRHELTDYAQLIAQSKAIQSYLKTKGLRKDARAALEKHLDPLSTLAPRVAKVTEQILDHVESESAKLPHNTTGLASSDIIESVFGKYKHFTAKGPLKEIGKLVLVIPAVVCDLSTQLIKEAMESVRTLDVDDWVSTHLGPSMLAKRRRALTPLVGDTKNA